MAKADLHVHSKYSEHLSEQFLRTMGAAESFTEPEFIYRTARELGMNFVTITDHNRIEGALMLKEKYPRDVFTGVESTVYFPEDGCSIHLLSYGITVPQFEEIQRLRTNIYDLRDYLKENGIAHSVAHATYSRNPKLNLEKLEKLILLFDVFEGINGGSSKINNATWMQVLNSLSPSVIEELYRKYRIEPFSADPWVKGLTGGSDDHGGLFLGKTYTVTPAATPEQFVENIKQKKTTTFGRHSDFKQLAFTLYKVGYDFSKTKSSSGSFISRVNEMIFDRKPLRLREKLAIKRMKYRNRRRKDRLQHMLLELLEQFNHEGPLTMEQKLDVVYDKIAHISDELIVMLLKSVTLDLKRGDIAGVVRNFSSSVLSVFLSLPFFASFKYMFKGRSLAQELTARFNCAAPGRSRKILWFTDTLNEKNGVASFLSKMASDQSLPGRHLTVTSTFASKTPAPDILPLKSIFSIDIPYFGQHPVSIPSLLGSLKAIYAQDPDEVYLSTFGPVGIYGLLVSRLLNVKTVGVYHAEYHQDLMGRIEADSIASIFNGLVRWFYSQCDEIKVTSPDAIDTLEAMGIDRTRIALLDVGAELPVPAPQGLSDTFVLPDQLGEISA